MTKMTQLNLDYWDEYLKQISYYLIFIVQVNI